ncbi:MAG: ABC transporter permease [Boseongicola sp.]
MRAISALALREMATTYGRSPGGWLWAIVEPVAAVALLAFAFSLAFRAPPLGVNFALFYATGLLPYMLFHDISQKVAASVRFSKPLFSFGTIRYLDALIARFCLNLLTHCIVILLVFSAILVVFRTGAKPDPLGIAIAISMAAVLAAGVGAINCYLFTAFPAWERIWAIATRPLFIISGVVFLFEDVPDQFQFALGLNPLFHVTGAMRSAVYPTYEPYYVSAIFVFGVATALLCLGLMLLNQFHDDLVHK